MCGGGPGTAAYTGDTGVATAGAATRQGCKSEGRTDKNSKRTESKTKTIMQKIHCSKDNVDVVDLEPFSSSSRAALQLQYIQRKSRSHSLLGGDPLR
jgi:hypothetical protein